MNVQNTYDSNWSVLMLEINIKHSHVTQSMELDHCAEVREYTLLCNENGQSQTA